MDLKIAPRKTVSICEMQPLTCFGLERLVASTPDFEFGFSYRSPAEWMHSPQANRTDILFIDKGPGARIVLDALSGGAHDNTRNCFTKAVVVIWCWSISEAEAGRALQAGAKGFIRKSADILTILACLRCVATGDTWIQHSIVRDSLLEQIQFRTELTRREHEVVHLVEKGYKDREIAQELGICSRTVKVHLRHVFEKTGSSSRFSLVLNGLRREGIISQIYSQPDSSARCRTNSQATAAISTEDSSLGVAGPLV